MQLLSGGARAAQVYPEKLVKTICKGIQLELKQNGMMALVYHDLLAVDKYEGDMLDYENDFVDDMSGQMLKKDLVITARKEEMAKYFMHNAYDKVPVAEAWNVTGKAPIGCRWIDINKGDDENPEYRSRLVAKEINRSASDSLFAATLH